MLKGIRRRMQLARGRPSWGWEWGGIRHREPSGTSSRTARLQHLPNTGSLMSTEPV